MSRTIRKEKKTHCKVVGCSICEDERIRKEHDRNYKQKKRQRSIAVNNI